MAVTITHCTQDSIMSSFSGLASFPEDNLQCPICLNVFSDPVTTPCGHNFCKTCLSLHWDKSDLCSCPMCNKRFHMRNSQTLLKLAE
uniref:RING-type domain-containing protein n=1 Tax=Sander lucioperca TaxID=283035 RepID=A0A8C9X2N0_SANLU